MNNTYYSGMPCSESLQHYGVQGMKWGVRRYQNKDGTRTSLGKKRYRKGGDLYNSNNSEDSIKAGSVKNAPRRLAEGIVRGMKQKLAEKMPFMLNDEELQRYTDRQRAENTYLNTRADKRQAKQRGKQEPYGITLLKNAANKAVGIAVDKTTNKAMDRLLETNNEKALREARTKKDMYDTKSEADFNRLNNTISTNDEKNLSDYKKMTDINDKVRKLEINMVTRRTKANKSDDSTVKARAAAQNAADKARIVLMKKESKDLLEDIKRRSEESNRARTSLKSNGYSAVKVKKYKKGDKND